MQANNGQAGGEEVADDLRCSIMKSMVVATTNCNLELTHPAVSTLEKEEASNDKDGLPEGKSQLKEGEVSENVNNREAMTASSKVDQTAKRQRQEAASSVVPSAAKDDRRVSMDKAKDSHKASNKMERPASSAMRDDRRVLAVSVVSKETINTSTASAARDPNTEMRGDLAA